MLLGISHTKNLVGSQISLYINGKPQDSVSFSYPKLKDVEHAYIATNGEPTTLQSKVIQPLICQMGVIYLLADSIDELEHKSIFERCGSSIRKSHNPSIGQFDSQFHLEKRRVDIFFAFSPHVSWPKMDIYFLKRIDRVLMEFVVWTLQAMT